jgi:hypothetical protein
MPQFLIRRLGPDGEVLGGVQAGVGKIAEKVSDRDIARSFMAQYDFIGCESWENWGNES